MSGLKEISKSFEKTIKDDNLHSLTADLSEAVIDNVLKEGLVKEIPIIGTLVGLGKVALGIRERLFLKKIISFLAELEGIDVSQRKAMVDQINSSKNYRIKVGEKLLYIIERCDDYEKAQLVGRLFSAFLGKRLTYSEFLKSATIVERAFMEDLKWFIKNNSEVEYLADAGELVNCGLFEIAIQEVYVNIKERWDNQDDRPAYDAITKGGEAQAHITPIARKIRDILKDLPSIQ